jgi:hypothetical protein
MRYVGVVTVMAGLLFVPLASGAIFGRAAEIPLAGTPVSVAVTDVTEDGSADVLVANAAAPTLTLLPGRQDGSFERPVAIGTGPTPRSFVVGDFDNDGSDDVAVAAGNQITIYLGADATLVKGSTLSADAPSILATGDLDGDGIADLVAGTLGKPVLSAYPGQGDGTFLPREQFALGSPAASLLIADLNGDEVPDVASSGTGVSVLFGNGDGTLQPAQAVGGPSRARAIAGEDFDADGSVDLVTASDPNLVTVLRNGGNGDFTGSGTYRVGAAPVAIAAVDVDGDGAPDVETANSETNDVSILLGLGDGRLRPQVRIKVGRMPTKLAVDDLDGEGTPDLVTVNRRSKSLTVMLSGANARQPVVCLVPTVARRTLAVARRLAAAGHCTVASVRRKYSKRLRRGRVIAVDPRPGTRLPADSAVTLLVSRGPKPSLR